jgi:hypothetical protein
MSGRKRREDQSGQATVEFALTLILLLSFTLFYLQLSFVFAFGNFVHYATFMSARAYLSAGPSRDDQVERAKNVITRMTKRSTALAGIDKFPSIARGTGGGDPAGFQVDPPEAFSPQDRNSSWMEGVRYTFRSRLFLIPLGRSTAGGGGGAARGPASGGRGRDVNGVTLTSESWLGREPNFDECGTDMSRKLSGIAIFDNGC